MPGRCFAKATATISSALVALVCYCAPITSLQAQTNPTPLEMLADAELTDIHFLDPDRGFAVGERGAIWRTENAGRNWRLIPSPLPYRWESVYFSDEQHGWIVGGQTQQLTHQSQGAVLRTRDGGRTWEAMEKLLLPTLKQVRFTDAKHGWAVGQISNFYPSGVFRTTDGGQTWTTAAGVAPIGWNGGALADQHGILVGPEGQVATLKGTTLQPAERPAIGPRPVRRVAMADERTAWLAGDGGLVLTSQTRGVCWQLPRGNIPSLLIEQVDFRALAVRGSHCWVAGAPGSIVLHTGDGGATWETFRTEQTAPLRALHFIDDTRGWAVGALGTILNTRDGGRTWLVQRRGGTRVALLNLFSEPQRVPLEAIARVSGNDGFLSATEILGRRGFDQPRSSDVPLDERMQAASALIGCSLADSAWHFPLRQRELQLSSEAIVALWDRANQGRGALALEAHAVLKIRQWRPEVIFTERSSPRGDDPLAHLTNQIVLAAVEKAADPRSYPEQIAQLGLTAWRTKKVLSLLPHETQGVINQSTAQLAPRLGGSLADVSAASRGLLYTEFRPAPQQLGFQVLINTLPADLGERDLMSGIVLTSGSEARRQLSETSPATLETLKRESQRARSIQQLMARSAADSASGGSWLGQVDQLTKGLSKASAGSTLYELGWRYQHSGQSASAADALQLLIDRYPEHELSDAALLWLVQYYASTEAGARLRHGTKAFSGGSKTMERQASYEAPAPLATPLVSRDPREDQPELMIRTQFSASPSGTSALERAHRANDLGQKIEQTRPHLFAQPELRFSLANAQRTIGFAKQAEGSYRTLGLSRPHDAWWSCAQSEQWLIQPTPLAPKQHAQCKRVARPKLDGVLDDATWKDLKPLALQPVATDEPLPPALAWLAHDGEFLYMAITCRKASGVAYPAPKGQRAHDSDLTNHDRVELHLDLDRDYATYYSFAVDHRGFTHEACVGDKSWNPDWYVAATENDTDWTIELAIPLPELDSRPPQARDTWAIGVQRVLPGVGMQSWNQPATAKVLPEGFGLLLFE
ncbi:MAG TPA: YCF48-related protein [Pirellulaceae bacterium]|nr:YCF48-related protein [Pirellulaceae bacterium]